MGDPYGLKKLWYVLLTAIICMVSLSGCWDSVEVKDLALVLASGIDRDEHGDLHGTLQIAVPSGGGGGGVTGGSQTNGAGNVGRNFVLVTEDGTDIKSMIQRLQVKVPRKLYFAHRVVVIIGEDQAKAGIRHILDYYARDPTNRLRSLIVISKGATAEKILEIPTVLEKIPGQEIKQIEEQEMGVVMTMQDFLMTTSTEGIAPIAPAISIVTNSSQQNLAMAGTAVFKDFKLVGYLSADETRGLLWLTGKLRRALITTYIPQDHGTIAMTLISANCEIKPTVRGHQAVFNVKLDGKGEIDENNTNLNLGDVQNFKRAKKVLDRTIQNNVQMSFDKAKEYDADIFGFGQEIARTNPRTWAKIQNNWEEIFKTAQLNLKVDIQPTRSGAAGPPAHLKEHEVKRTS